MSYLSFNTSDTKGLFQNNFNQDFIIEEESSIGLVNIKFQAIEQVFDETINSFGERFRNVIRFSVSDDDNNNLYQCVVDDINFRKTISVDPLIKKTVDIFDNIILPTNLNFNFILKELSYQLNNIINMQDNRDKTIGFQVMFETNRQPNPDKVMCKFATFPYINPKDLFFLEGITFTELTDEYTYNSATALNIDVDNSKRMYIPQPFTHGNGFFRVRIDKFDITNIANTNSGFTIALVKEDPTNWSSTHQQDILIGVNLPHNGHNYRYIHNDVYHNSSVAPQQVGTGGANNDVVSIERRKGKLRCVIYQENDTETEIFNIDLTEFNPLPTDSPPGDGTRKFASVEDEILYPVIFFGGINNNLVLSNPRVHLDPFDSNIQYDTPLDDLGTYGTVEPLIPSSKTSSVSRYRLEFHMVKETDIDKVETTGDDENDVIVISFSKPDTTHFDVRKHLGRFLGFQSINNELTAVNEGNFIAENTFRPTFYSKMYYLECQNLELDTYTSIGGGKKNILLPLPIYNRFDHHYITYEPNNLYMVKLKNINKIPLRSFRFRLLDQNLEPVNVVGRSDLTVVIDK